MGKLIDADKLKEALNGKEVMWYPDSERGNTYDGTTYDCTTIVDIIDEQPEAYSVEKVVKQLEEEKEFSFADFESYARELGYEEDDNDWFYMGLWRAVQIVKAGGQND